MLLYICMNIKTQINKSDQNSKQGIKTFSE